jgi:hypothetical protein
MEGMDTSSLYEDTSWAEILARLSSDIDLATTARDTKAFVRSRGVRDPATLLRLALAYGAGGLSLRRTVAWAEAAGVARISDVSLLDRLRNAKDWLELLWRTKLERLATPVPLPGLDLSVRLIDATSISRPGSTGTDWRLHMDYRPLEGRFGGAVFSDGRTSEGFHHFTAGPGELVVGDRGYAKAKGLQAIHEAEGHFLVRIGWRSLILLDDRGETIDIIGQLGGLPPDEITTAPDAATPDQLVSLYRLRWQIEIAFKRLKSLMNIDELPAKDPELARSWLSAKLLTALLIDTDTHEVAESSPSGP